MLTEGHIFTIKTKDPQNVADIQSLSSDVVISGLNILKDNIKCGDLTFVVFGGDNPPWETGLVALARISKEPYDFGYDPTHKKNFRVNIDIALYFDHVVRGDLVPYPDTFDTIGVGPITKWEPNQAISAVARENAVGLLQAICEIRPGVQSKIKLLLGEEFSEIEGDVRRFILASSKLGKPYTKENTKDTLIDLCEEFRKWMVHVGKSEKTARDTATCYLPSISDDCQEPVKNLWHGIREYLYGERPNKKVYEVSSLKELMEIYSGVDRVFSSESSPGPFDPERFTKCWEWAHDTENHRSVSAAWSLYKQFLTWRDKQQKQDEKLPEVKVDRLSIALRLFADNRASTKLAGWQSYDEYTRSVRNEFVHVDESLLDDPSFDYTAYMRKYAISWQVANTKFSGHTEAEKRAVLRYLKQQYDNPKTASWYIDTNNRLTVDGAPVHGMAPTAILYFMSELHPEEFASISKVTYESLAYLGLHEGVVPGDSPTLEEYQYCRAKQQGIIDKMKEMGVGKASDDKSPADYRTVNEFLWWLHEDDNQNLIKEIVMSKQFKNVARKPISGNKKLSDAMKDELLLRLAAALRTKPFAILAGHSGTGKSRLVRRLAYMTCTDETLMEECKVKNAPGNYCMIQVKPNWHDSTDLLGYYSEITRVYRSTDFVRFVAKAYAYPKVPFFVCLDEMNLAPVEQYFAEYLSAIESADDKSGEYLTDQLIPKAYSPEQIIDDDSIRFTESKNWLETHGLTIPKNLFVVGTVNMDDTTCQFSRKVLDRAMTIMVDRVDFKDMQDAAKNNPPSENDLLDSTDVAKFLGGKLRAAPLSDKQVELLNRVNKVLGKTAFAVAYRFANEYALYEDSLAGLTGKTKDAALETMAMDHCILMKVLPRIHGESGAVKKCFEENDVGGLKGVLGNDPKMLSVAKMDEILCRGETYLSFWP